MKETILLVNWYKKSGKCYAKDALTVPNYVSGGYDAVKEFIIQNQTQLQDSWVNNECYVSTTAIFQNYKDARFFEHLYKFNID